MVKIDHQILMQRLRHKVVIVLAVPIIQGGPCGTDVHDGGLRQLGIWKIQIVRKYVDSMEITEDCLYNNIKLGQQHRHWI